MSGSAPDMATIAKLHQALLSWFAGSARPLPWREQYLPYQVWVSEIMLQQTQAERGAAYFRHWVARFPDVAALAAASEEEVLKCWEGLGYYSRARNLHAAAKRVMHIYGGELPDTLSGLELLPGIGKYTARAILSIAFQQDYPVVDGNVERLFARMFAIDEPVKTTAGQARIWRLADALLPLGQARAWNQALMEFGALVCGRGTPRCAICPLSGICESFQTGTTAVRPVVGGDGRKTVRVSLAAAVIVDDRNRVGVRQRPANVRWASMWELPGVEFAEGADPREVVAQLFQEQTGQELGAHQPLPTVTHKYTKYLATVHPFLCRLGGTASGKLLAGQVCRWVSLNQLNALAFSSGHRQIIDCLPEFLDEG